MFGIQYIKAGPTQYVIHYANGKIKHAGAGEAFYYYRPTSTISIVPIGSADAPFIFNEITADFQPITVQGQLTYRVVDAKLVASLLDYTVGREVDQYLTEDPDKLPQRLVNIAQVLTRAQIQERSLRAAIQASEDIANAVFSELQQSEALKALGVEVLTLSIIAVKPTPESARALEAEAREAMQQQADEAIYDRRNSAVEQERRIKENELNTEIAVEEKKRKIRETKAEANLAVEAKEQEIREMKLTGQIKLETDRKALVSARTENARAEADAQAYAVEASLRPLSELDSEILQMLAMQSAEPRLMVTMALKQLAENAGKIGNLNISPDLLNALLEQ